MNTEYRRFYTAINDIEFKMLRKGGNCWIKVVPVTQSSSPSSVHIVLNGEEHHWDIYDKSGRDVHKVYFKGYRSTPSFYLKSGQNCFRVDCNYDDIKVLPIAETHKMDTYIKKNCNLNSSQASCWAIAIYSTISPVLLSPSLRLLNHTTYRPVGLSVGLWHLFDVGALSSQLTFSLLQDVPED